MFLRLKLRKKYRQWSRITKCHS